MIRKFKPASISPKLFQVLKQGYSFQDFIKDLTAGITVGIISLPLALAFAIASGVAPEKGLITAVVAGFFISFLGGSRYQIGGPTGAFVVIVYGIVSRHGEQGLILATIMAGGFLFIFGYSKLGTYIKFIPYPVTAGFTAGIGVVLIFTELKDFMGLQIESLSPEFILKCRQYFDNIHTINYHSSLAGLATVLIIIFIRRKTRKIPAHIISITVVTVAVYFAGADIETIGSRFGHLSGKFPAPSFPEYADWDMIKQLFPDALTIALLAAIESLLSAVIADSMSGDRHDSNTELTGQAAGNFFSGLFGGIPATGAVARTVTNIKLGARTPVAGIIHALILLLSMLCLTRLVEMIPMPAIAGVLIIVSWDMIGIKELALFRNAPRSDTVVMLTSLVLTVVIDLTVAVQVGVIMSALMFMKHMSDVTNLEVAGVNGAEENFESNLNIFENIPEEIGIYEIVGPLFFGVADKLIYTLESINNIPKIMILRMRRVPTMDATGAYALNKFYSNCVKKGVHLIISGVQVHGQTRKVMERDGIFDLIGRKNVVKNIDIAIERALDILHEFKTAEDSKEEPAGSDALGQGAPE